MGTPKGKRERKVGQITDHLEGLAKNIHKTFFSEVRDWEPLTGDALGLITQIDNMVCGLRRHKPEPKKSCALYVDYEKSCDALKRRRKEMAGEHGKS
jgi:hypothetical protein